MELTKEQERRVKDIIDNIKCESGFECQKRSFKELPKHRLVVSGQLIECLENRHKSCKFAVSYGSGTFCECPLLNYIVKDLKD